MSKLDSYMPLYGNDLLAAVMGYDSTVGMAYVWALWHYWHQTHCEGLPNDEEYLRKICMVDLANWGRTKPIVFGRFFQLEDGMWHNSRARDEYRKFLEGYQRRCAATATARRVKASKSAPDTDAGTDTDTGVDSTHKPKPKPKPELESKVVCGAGAPPRQRNRFDPPTIAEVRLQAAKLGIPEIEGDKFYNHWESVGWKRKGSLLVSWVAAMSQWAINYRTNFGRDMQPKKPSYAPNI